MLEKFLNKKVKVYISNYGAGSPSDAVNLKEGTITALDENFIELDSDEIIAIRYIRNIKNA